MAVATVAATLALFPVDESIEDAFAGSGSRWTRLEAAGAKVMGDGYVMLPAAGLAWGVGALANQPRLARAARNGLEAWALTQLIVQPLKYGLGRSRPSESGSSWDWCGPGAGSRHQSFPSGHGSTAWGVLPAFALEYKDTWWVPVLVYTGAASTSLSRLQDGEHWASDVVFAAGVGLLANRLVRRWNERGAAGGTVAVAFAPGHGSVVWRIALP